MSVEDEVHQVQAMLTRERLAEIAQRTLQYFARARAAGAATALEEGLTEQDLHLVGLVVARGRALVIGVETDLLFPIEQQEALAIGLQAHVSDVSFRRLSSIQGHDSFLVDMDRFRPAIASFF